MTIENIAKACQGKLHRYKHNINRLSEVEINVEINVEVKGAVIDSRQVEAGYLFIATRGERVDGHSFIEQVIEKGAICIVCEEKPLNERISYILVENSFLALKQIAAYYREQLSIKVVGITGSVGKTTTKEFIASVLEQRYNVLKTAGNFNNEVGLPLTILKIKEEHEIAILEMGINQFGEMDRLGAIAKPDICVITNIGQCHLEYLGTREGILKAKTEVLPHIKEGGWLCINGDDELLATLPQTDHMITFGLSRNFNTYATSIENRGLLGSQCQIQTVTGNFEVFIPLAGQHMIYNALAATVVAELLGLNQVEITKGLREVKALGGRSNILQNDQRTIIDDCYNANPVSMKAALDLLSLATTRKIAILGDMGELGIDSDKLHGEVGIYAIDLEIDLLICIGKSSYNMKEQARIYSEKIGNKVTNIQYFETKEQVIELLKELLDDQNKETVLVKASRFMGLETIVKALLP